MTLFDKIILNELSTERLVSILETLEARIKYIKELINDRTSSN